MTWQHTFACCLSRNPTVKLLSKTWILSLTRLLLSMDKDGLDVYSPEIGERLIQYCEVALKVCASRVTRARVIVRKLNRLNQGLDSREALWGDC